MDIALAVVSIVLGIVTVAASALIGFAISIHGRVSVLETEHKNTKEVIERIDASLASLVDSLSVLESAFASRRTLDRMDHGKRT